MLARLSFGFSCTVLYVNSTGALKNIRVVLTRTSHPGNIGAAARALKTMGLSELFLVKPRHFPHPDADARASGALDVLQHAQVHDSLAAALGGCVLAVATSSRPRELRHEMMTAREAARELLAQAALHPVAVVFGNETSGLSGEEARLCRVWAYIPANPEYASLNLAAAVQVFAYELRTALPAGSSQHAPEIGPASLEQVEQLYQHLGKTMAHTGFFDPANPKRLLPRLRRLLARARLEPEEVNILRGFLQAVDKLRR
jgi:tRNA/rRNA methyltransferase